MTVKSNEYANALFSLSKENGCEKQVFESLETAKSVIEETDGFINFVSSPSISKDERTNVIKTAFAGKVHEYVLAVLCLLCENKSFDVFYEFYDEFVSMYSESTKISVASVVTAKELTDDEKAKLSEKLEKISGHSVRIETQIDPSILGGITVTMDGKLYDGSVKSRLKSIKEVMNG